MRNFLFILLLSLVLACKSDKTTTESPSDTTTAVASPAGKDPSTLAIPDACQMVTPEDLKAIFSVPAAAINVKVANDPSAPNSKSCYFQWDDPNTPNAGILINIMTMSKEIYAEAPNYFSLLMETKLKDGETTLGNDKPDKYKKFNAGGNNIGAYSFNQSRFYWNLGNDYMFMLAFNISTLSEPKMVKAAEEIVAKVNSNFASKVK